MNEEQTLVDYAAPCMAAEKALKDLHNAILERDYEKAYNKGLDALVEVRMTLNAIRHALHTEQK